MNVSYEVTSEWT